MDRLYAWMRYLGFGSRADAMRREHSALADVARSLRRAVLPKVAQRAQLDPDHRVLAAIERIPRERFVPVDAIRESTRDVAIPLDREGRASVSAMHAYARAFGLLDIREGDTVLDLGAGTGYGTAILSELVGDAGHVHAIEIDPALTAQAAKNLEGRVNVTLHTADALDPSSWPAAATKIYVAFALADLPPSWLTTNTTIVAPLTDPSGAQHLTRITPTTRERFERVLYVPTRTPPPPKPHKKRVSLGTVP